MVVSFLDSKYIEQFRDNINNDAEFRLASRFMAMDVMLGIGDSGCIISVNDGAISDIVLNPVGAETCSVTIKGTAESWQKFLQPLPPPHYNGLFAAMISSNLLVEGDIETAFAHFWALTRLLDVLRHTQNNK